MHNRISSLVLSYPVLPPALFLSLLLLLVPLVLRKIRAAPTTRYVSLHVKVGGNLTDQVEAMQMWTKEKKNREVKERLLGYLVVVVVVAKEHIVRHYVRC